MRKGCEGEKKTGNKKNGERKMKVVGTTSLPAANAENFLKKLVNTQFYGIGPI